MLNRSKKYKYKIAQYLEDIPKPRKNEIVLIPDDNRVMGIPPYLGRKKLPSWWKNLPIQEGSLRRCQGVYDFTTAGITIPLWCDVTIRPDPTGKFFEFRTSSCGDDYTFAVGSFQRAQAQGCPIGEFNKIPTGQFIKLVTPWKVRTPKGVSLITMPMFFEPNPDYTVVPGIVHTDFYNHVNIVINITTDKEFVIPAGTLIQQMIPYHRHRDFKRIIWGNESMTRFIRGNGLAKGSLATPDDSRLYRSKQMEIEKDLGEKKWYSFFKK
jgi:hypothetical protein